MFPVPEACAAELITGLRDFYESNKHDIWQASATSRDEKKERAGALFKIFISLMDVQTSTVGTENCDNIEYNEQTILAEYAHIIWSCSADSRWCSSLFRLVSFFSVTKSHFICSLDVALFVVQAEIKWT